MLTPDQLQGLYKKLREASVLSVYIDGGQTDPANRRAWFTALARGLDEEQRRLEAHMPDELPAFDAARSLIEGELERHQAFLPERGWVGFATEVELKHAEGLPVPMPDLVRWELGIRVAPYVRALKQDRVVVAALADRRKARIFTYHGGDLSEREDLIADLDHGDLSESAASNRAPAQTGSTGSRGETGTDAGQRALDVSASRMQARLLEVVGGLAGNDGFVVLGGTPEVVSALARQAGRFAGRHMERTSMHLAMSEAEVKAELEEAASELTRGAQGTLLSQVVDAAKSRGKGCLGIQATKEALREGRVDSLLVTRALREREVDLADHFVGTAFEQGAAVEELSAAEAARLDEEGEGVGARLRYTT